MKFNKYLIGMILIFAILPLRSQDLSKISNNDRSMITMSRVVVGDGARVIVDTDREAKFLYDEIVLSKNAKYIFDKEELNFNRTDNGEEGISSKEVNGLPTELTISKAFPNPFNPVVNISYGLPKSADVNIQIYDLMGKKVMDYYQPNQIAGWHEYIWSATDINGKSLGSGVYLMTIRAGDMVKHQKITFLK